MSRNMDNTAETRAVKALAALAQTSRLRVFRLLVGTGNDGLCPGQIADALAMPANALSFHLKELQNCGLITKEREGRFLRYRADLEIMRQLMGFLTAHCCRGEPCIAMPVIECPAPAIQKNPAGKPETFTQNRRTVDLKLNSPGSLHGKTDI